MNLWTFIKDKKKRKVWLRAFRIWQHRPHEVAPLVEETQQCASCGTVYTGQYCPRCGQSKIVGRFSFKKALTLFFDTWGIGNRSMTRSIRDLLLRPGYMIRDYIRGMQSAYFPPFKMFFLLTALSLLVENSSALILGAEKEQTKEQTTEQKAEQTAQATQGTTELMSDGDKKMEARLGKVGNDFFTFMDRLQEKNQAIFSLLMMLLFFMPMYLFLRKSPTIPDLRYSEFVIALVYISNSFTVYQIVADILSSEIINILGAFMALAAFSQFSGYGKFRILLSLILTAVFSMILLVGLVILAIYIMYLTV